MTIITLQPAPVVDHVLEDGTELTRLPYPFHVDAKTGDILRQDFWRGDPLRVVGFQRDADIQRVDVWWEAVAAKPELAIGLFPVTVDRKGGIASWSVPIEHSAVTEG